LSRDGFQAPIKLHPDGISFAVRLTPRGGRDTVEGWSVDSAGQQYLRVRVRAVPEDGKANAALVALLAKELDIPRASVTIVNGAKARLKIVKAHGQTEKLTAKLPKLALKTEGISV
jgi:uncharacterized protein YggU (UPF0235/DUF167 family)